MDYNAHAQDGHATHDSSSIAALQAFEKLSLQSQTPTKNASPRSRPSTSDGPTTGSPRFPSPLQTNFLRRSSSSLAQPGSLPSPELRKRLSTSSLKGASSPVSPRFPNSRRSSSGIPMRPVSQMSFASATVPEDPPPKPWTAATVGAEYFQKELAAHELAQGDTETVVIIHEACYGHRFSRPRTSKAALSTIVERPERITAAVLGLSTAYVRLGSRHAGGQNAPSLEHAPLVPPPFAIRRSSRAVGLLSPAVVAVHGSGWMDELQSMCLAAGARLALDGKELLRPVRLDPAGNPVESQAFHEGDLYLCAESLEALQGAMGGVCDAVDAVFSSTLTKRAFVAVRPPGHHCSADFPSGFCWLNNVHVGIQYAAQTYGLTHAVILDFDLHHGDGSQDITWNLNEKSTTMPKNAPHSKKISIGYYSLHDINSYPCEWGDKEKVQNASLCIDNAHGQSIWNVHLEPWKTEEDFSRLYETKYYQILEKARTFLQKKTSSIAAASKGGKPKSAVFISAGFDASQWEGAGMQRHAVNVPTSFYERFTKDAVKMAQDESTGAEGRVISVLEGGYSNRALTSGVLSHVSGLCQKSLSFEDGIVEGIKTENADTVPLAQAEQKVQKSDSRWWALDALTALENYEAVEAPAPKKVQRGLVPTFASSTASFSQKVRDPEKFQRSMSGTMRLLPEPEVDLSIPPVDWVAASHALCKLLVPTHRTTTSCKPEELAAPRTKKQRQTLDTFASVEPTSSGRQLRDRKAKPVENGGFSEDEVSRQRASRRKTLADVPTAGPAEDALTRPKRSSRRSSAVSGMDTIQQSAGPVPDVPQIPSTYAQGPPQPAASTPKQSAPAARRRKSPSKGKAPARATVSPLTAEAPLPSVPKSEPTPTPSLTTESSNASFATAPTSTASSAPDALENLTSGIKRITLKVGTREEHDRRVAAHLAAELEAERAAQATQTARARAEGIAAASVAAPASGAEPAADLSSSPVIPPSSGTAPGNAAAKPDARRKPRKLAASKTKKFEAAGDAVVPPSGMSLTKEGGAEKQMQTFRPAGVANMVVAHELKRPGSAGRAAQGGAGEGRQRPVSSGQDPGRGEGQKPGPVGGAEEQGAMPAPFAEAIAGDVAAAAAENRNAGRDVTDTKSMSGGADGQGLGDQSGTSTPRGALDAPSSAIVPDSAARQLLGEHAAARLQLSGGEWGAGDSPVQDVTNVDDGDKTPRAVRQGLGQGMAPGLGLGMDQMQGQGQRGKLPVFSSTGTIPFGAAAGGAAPDSVMGLSAGAGWDGNGLSRSMLGIEEGASRAVTPVGEAEGEKREDGGAGDIWEVPETPVKK